MQRRDFLRLLGLGAAAAALGPSTIVQAAPGLPAGSELLVTRYAFSTIARAQSQVTAFVLEAPAGKRCRAIVEITDPDTVVCPFGIGSGNDIAQVIIDRIGRPDDQNLFQATIDAAIFCVEDMYCPIDLGALDKDCPLEIDYAAMPGSGDQTLLLALFHTNVPRADVSRCPQPFQFPKVISGR